MVYTVVHTSGMIKTYRYMCTLYRVLEKPPARVMPVSDIGDRISAKSSLSEPDVYKPRPCKRNRLLAVISYMQRLRVLLISFCAWCVRPILHNNVKIILFDCRYTEAENFND